MTMDYTVIEQVRQRFAPSPTVSHDDYLANADGPWAGMSKTFHFDCPNITTGDQTAVLQFATVHVGGERGFNPPTPVLRVNGQDVPGGFQGPGPYWRTQTLLVPQFWLKEHGNTLYIAAIDADPPYGTPVDIFVIDNIVLFYKTHASGTGGGAGRTSAAS